MNIKEEAATWRGPDYTYVGWDEMQDIIGDELFIAAIEADLKWLGVIWL